jgi:hypothetical protein
VNGVKQTVSAQPAAKQPASSSAPPLMTPLASAGQQFGNANLSRWLQAKRAIGEPHRPANAEPTTARRAGAGGSESLPIVKPMPREEAREVLLGYLEGGGKSDSFAAMDAISAVLQRPFTLESSATRLRLLTAAFSLLDRDGAARVLEALTAPVGTAQKHLRDRFNNLDRHFRFPLLDILRAQIAAKQDEPRASPSPQLSATWSEVRDGVFAAAPNSATTVGQMAAYLSGNPEMPTVLAELNGLDPRAHVAAAQPLLIPVEFIDRSGAVADMPAKLRRRIAERRQALADHEAFYRTAKVRTRFDPYVQKITDLRVACRMAVPYIPKAIERRVGEVASGLVAGLLDFAFDAITILAASTAIGAAIGALAGGVGAIPGAQLGFEIGVVILQYYGLYMLVEAILGIAGSLMAQLGRFVSRFWNANGREEFLDEAGAALAEAIGILASAILLALVAYLMKKSGDALRNTRFAKTLGEKPLVEWLTQRRRLQTTQALRADAPRRVVLGREAHQVRFEVHEGRLRLCLCTACSPIIEQADAMLERTPPSHPARGKIANVIRKAQEAETRMDEALEGELGAPKQQQALRLKNELAEQLNAIAHQHPELFGGERGTVASTRSDVPEAPRKVPRDPRGPAPEDATDADATFEWDPVEADHVADPGELGIEELPLDNSSVDDVVPSHNDPYTPPQEEIKVPEPRRKRRRKGSRRKRSQR